MQRPQVIDRTPKLLLLKILGSKCSRQHPSFLRLPSLPLTALRNSPSCHPRATPVDHVSLAPPEGPSLFPFSPPPYQAQSSLLRPPPVSSSLSCNPPVPLPSPGPPAPSSRLLSSTLIFCLGPALATSPKWPLFLGHRSWQSCPTWWLLALLPPDTFFS